MYEYTSISTVYLFSFWSSCVVMVSIQLFSSYGCCNIIGQGVMLSLASDDVVAYGSGLQNTHLGYTGWIVYYYLDDDSLMEL